MILFETETRHVRRMVLNNDSFYIDIDDSIIVESPLKVFDFFSIIIYADSYFDSVLSHLLK